jgi:phosphatidylglycerophosphate synthase
VKTVGGRIGDFFVWARDHVARGLLRIGVTPNILTVLGMIVTLAAAVLFARGQWLWAGIALVVAGACDMLDGAVARIGRKKSPFGGILDSTCDRVGDIALLSGLGYYYLVTWTTQAAAPRPANITYGLLAVFGIIHVTLISYIRARAEDEIDRCEVGFWKRGERYACMVIGAFSQNPAIILWELGLWTGPTALHRLLHAREVISTGRAKPRGERNLLWRLVFFDEPRGTWAYDVHTGTAIALLLFARIGETDLLRELFGLLGG